MKSLDVVALGTCYVDTNLAAYPFDDTGILPETELIGKNYEMVAGGSAVNFCRSLSQTGLHTGFIGIAGVDPNGDLLEQLLEHDQVTPLLVRDTSLLTNVSFNMTNPRGQHIMLTAGTANAALHPDMILPKLEKTLPESKILYLGGCLKLSLLAPHFVQIATATQQHNTQLVIDHGRVPSDVSPELRKAVQELALQSTFYLTSRKEFCDLWQFETIEQAANNFYEHASTVPQPTVIVKDGANGAYYWDDHTLRHTPALTVDTVDNVTGAGDAFNAGFIAASLQGRSIADSAHNGCAVAAEKITKQRAA